MQAPLRINQRASIGREVEPAHGALERVRMKVSLEEAARVRKRKQATGSDRTTEPAYSLFRDPDRFDDFL